MNLHIHDESLLIPVAKATARMLAAHGKRKNTRAG
jgi:hypothetical protein